MWHRGSKIKKLSKIQTFFPALIRTILADLQSNSGFTLVTSEPCQTGLVPFLKANISRITGTCQVPVILLILAFKNGTKPVWHGSEVASVNTLLYVYV